MSLFESSPQGLRELFLATSPAEAELLRSVLIEAGFHPEYVPSDMSAIGPHDNSQIYIEVAEYDQALAYLHEYQAGEPEPEKE